MVWFEPEHVNATNVLYKQHPDWLLSVTDDPGLKRQINQGIALGERRVLNLGNPEALEWTVELFSRLIKDEGVDIYRLDFNIEPLIFWGHNDAPDRQGMTENLYVQGYLRFLDALLERHPQLLIDTCSSGGRRNDLETLRRAVPLWLSDRHGLDVILQDQRYGLALWIPYFGTGTHATNSYQFRSSCGSSLVTSWDVFSIPNSDGSLRPSSCLPGYTHHQPAMATTFGHLLLSFAEPLSRDIERLIHWLALFNKNPLGAAAGYGTTFNLDRQLTSKLLGFDGPTENVTDPITQRWEPEAELAYDLAVMMEHLSTMAETLIFFSTREFNMVGLSDRHCTGSSIMPQKRNPCSLEVIKAKASFAQGIVVSLLSTGKALFTGYNRDEISTGSRAGLRASTSRFSGSRKRSGS